MRVVALVVTLMLGSAVDALATQVRDQPATTVPRIGTAVLSGTLVTDDELKRPVRRATVTVMEEGGGNSGRMTVTNDSGEFMVTGLPAGRYLVTATKGAYLDAPYGATRPQRPGTVRTGNAVTVSDGQHISGLVLRMMRGAVITGVIRDETGQPARGVAWMIAHYARSPQSGERVMTRLQGAAGTGTTDSRGMYRIYGLPPGEYVVGALPTGPATTDLMVTTEAEKARATTPRPSGSSAPPPPPARPRVGFVPVYYPGTTMPAEAALIRVGPGDERTGIDFNLQLVSNARVEGAVIGLDGQPVPSTTVMVYSDAKPASVEVGRFGARTDPRGQFSLRGLPPGSYTIAAAYRSDTWGTTTVSIQGDDVRANIQLRTAIVISGTIGMDDGTSIAPADLSRVRLRMTAESSALPIASGGYTFPVGADGRFKAAVMPGRYRLHVTAPGATGAASSWILKSAIVGKEDVADQAFEVNEGDNVLDAVLTFTNQSSELSGRMIDAGGRAAPEYFVIVYPTDPVLWGWQARRIQQKRPSHDGVFSFSGLPPGEYFIAAVTDVDQNEWFDPEFLKSLTESSIRVTLAGGDKKTQTIQVK